MQSLLFVIAIMGCGEGDSPCREVQVAPPRFASEAACTAATATVLARYTELSFPSVVAQCRPASAGAVQLRGRDVMLPEARPDQRQRFAAAAPVRSFR
jgi:hypothetical protein